MSRDDVSRVPVSWQVYFAGEYIGLVATWGGRSFRAYGVDEDLDLGPVAVEAQFVTSDEAVDWLVDGHLQEAGS